jgi:hypothetical protein
MCVGPHKQLSKENEIQKTKFQHFGDGGWGNVFSNNPILVQYLNSLKK